MAGYIDYGAETFPCIHVGDKVLRDLPQVKPHNLKSIQLDCGELDHAIQNLGAAPVNKRVVTYYGDEAKRIFFNW